MLYIVGTGVNGMKNDFVYCSPFSLEAFKSQPLRKVINICSGNAYTVETDVVVPEQVFTTLGDALTFANKKFSELNLNHRIEKFINGNISEDVFLLSMELAAAVGNLTAEASQILNTINSGEQVDVDALIKGKKILEFIKEL